MMSEEKETLDPSREAGTSEAGKETGPEPETQAQRGDSDAAESGSGAFDDEVQELKDKYLRLFAEFDNYKKRTVRERLDLMRSASQDILAALLPVLDDFDRAKKNAEDQGRAEDPVVEGLFLVYHKLYAMLRQKGLEEMESNGLPFDPEMHEAITEIPAPSPELKGKVMDTVEKGYRLNDKIIRYAKVVVGA